MSLLLIPALYYALFTVLAYLLSFTPLPVTRPIFIFLHLTTLILIGIFFYRSFVYFLRSITCPPGYAKHCWRGIIRIIRIILVLLPSLLLFYLIYTGFAGYLTPPHNHDAGNHFFLIRRVLDTHSLRYAAIYHGFTTPFWYPLAFHWFIASLLSIMGTADLLRFVFPLVWLLATIYPLSVFYLTRTLSRSFALAMTAEFISITWLMFPYNTFAWGGWPMLLGLTLLWFTLGLFYSLLNSPNLIKLISCLLLLASLFLTHPSEIFSFVLLSLPALFLARRSLIVKFRPFGKPLILLVLATGLLLFPILQANLTHLGGQADLTAIDLSTHTLTQYFELLTDFHVTFNQNYLFTLLALTGFILLIVKRRYPAFTLSLALIFLLLTLRVLTHLLNQLHLLTFPWLESERIYYLAVPFLSFTAAYILFTSYLFLRARVRSTTYLIAILIVLTLPLVGLYLKTLKLNRYKLQVVKTENAPADYRDLLLLQRNRHRCHLYLNDPKADAGRFIPYLSGDQVIFDGPYGLLPDLKDRFSLLDAAKHASLSAQLNTLHQKLPFDCLYSGAFTVFDTPPEMPPPQLNSNPALIILDEQDGSVIYGLTQDSTPSAFSPRLPLTLSAADGAQLKKYLTGDIGEVETSADGQPFRRVATTLSLWTQLPAKNLTFTGISAHDQPQACQVTVDGQIKTPLTFLPTAENVVIDKLNLTSDQHQITLTCTKPPDSSHAFAFTTIMLE